MIHIVAAATDFGITPTAAAVILTFTGVTNTVGIFPRSRTRDFGLHDLAGNVFEWCDSWCSEHRVSRVLCGGSFVANAANVRSASRYYSGLPVARNSEVGFRVARTHP